jgi:hypothetical protein
MRVFARWIEHTLNAAVCARKRSPYDARMTRILMGLFGIFCALWPPSAQARGICTGARKYRVEGNPDPKHVSTSYVERQNLNIRMGNRRITRLTNTFSKKAENHAHMMAIYFMHYNFVRIHQTLKVAPAMEAGVTSKLWEMSDLVRVLEDWEAGGNYGK